MFKRYDAMLFVYDSHVGFSLAVSSEFEKIIADANRRFQQLNIRAMKKKKTLKANAILTSQFKLTLSCRLSDVVSLFDV